MPWAIGCFLSLDDHVELAAVLNVAALPAAVGAQQGLQGFGEMGRVQGDEAHAAVLDAVDDATDVLLGDLVVQLVSPPDEHVGLVERIGGHALFGVGYRGRDDFPTLGLQRFEALGHRAADVVRIDLFGSGPFGPDDDAMFRLRFRSRAERAVRSSAAATAPAARTPRREIKGFMADSRDLRGSSPVSLAGRPEPRVPP